MYVCIKVILFYNYLRILNVIHNTFPLSIKQQQHKRYLKVETHTLTQTHFSWKQIAFVNKMQVV